MITGTIEITYINRPYIRYLRLSAWAMNRYGVNSPKFLRIDAEAYRRFQFQKEKAQ